MTRVLLGLIALVVAFVAGCGGSAAQPATATLPPSPAPAGVAIDRIAATSTLIPLGKQPNGEIETPDVKTPMQAGWYALGVTPGDPGPAVIVGHVDGAGKPGIFKRLHELQPGDSVRVLRAEGPPAEFRVYETLRAPKQSFPTARVYADTPGPELRLITCGGAFVGGDLGYAENVIVFLRQVT